MIYFIFQLLLGVLLMNLAFLLDVNEAFTLEVRERRTLASFSCGGGGGNGESVCVCVCVLMKTLAPCYYISLMLCIFHTLYSLQSSLIISFISLKSILFNIDTHLNGKQRTQTWNTFWFS